MQSSKSWYLKIALILNIKNPLPRGVGDGTADTNPKEQHLRKSGNLQNKYFVFTDIQAALYSEPQPGPSAYFPAW